MQDHYDILVIVAHPDDAEFGAAGAVARWVQEGRSVAYIVCTNGEKGTGDRSLHPEELAEIRREEQRQAAASLGVDRVVFLGMVDQELEETPQFRKEIVRLLRRFRPETVVTSDPYRRYVWHRDHRIIGQVVLDAAFPYARDHLAYPDLLDEGLEPHKVETLLFFGAEEVNYHVDIKETFKKKLAALKCHASQLPGFGTGQLDAWIEQRCRKMAHGSELELAEAFHRVRMPS